MVVLDENIAFVWICYRTFVFFWFFILIWASFGVVLVSKINFIRLRNHNFMKSLFLTSKSIFYWNIDFLIKRKQKQLGKAVENRVRFGDWCLEIVTFGVNYNRPSPHSTTQRGKANPLPGSSDSELSDPSSIMWPSHDAIHPKIGWQLAVGEDFSKWCGAWPIVIYSESNDFKTPIAEANTVFHGFSKLFLLSFNQKIDVSIKNRFWCQK